MELGVWREGRGAGLGEPCAARRFLSATYWRDSRKVGASRDARVALALEAGRGSLEGEEGVKSWAEPSLGFFPWPLVAMMCFSSVFIQSSRRGW